ncbi:acyltransferase family protein [Spirillospora sp. NPDC050679]
MTYTTRPFSAPEPPPHPRRSPAHSQTPRDEGAPGGGPLDTGPLGTGPLDTGPLGTGPLGTGPLPAGGDAEPAASGYPLAPAGESPAIQHPGIFASAAFPDPAGTRPPAEPLAAPVMAEQDFPGTPAPPPPATVPIHASQQPETAYTTGPLREVPSLAQEPFPAPPPANEHYPAPLAHDPFPTPVENEPYPAPPANERFSAPLAHEPAQTAFAPHEPAQAPFPAHDPTQAPFAPAAFAPNGAVQAPPATAPDWTPQPDAPAWAPHPEAPAPARHAPSDGPARPEPPAADQAAGNAPAPRRKERDPYFDNAKFLAILLVVIGHSLANKMNVPLAKGLYIFIYMFHMPLFIVITGYFSRNWTFSGGKARKLITNVGVPYVVFETAYSLYDWLVGRNELEVSLLNPYFLTWFLCALFMWRLSTPVWQQIRWPLGVATVFSLLSYMSDLGGTFDIHRVIGLLPFYVLGLMLRPEHFELLKKPMARVVGIVVMLGGLGVAWIAKDRMTHTWIYWKTPHQDLGVDNVTGTLMRLAMFACAFVLVAAFLTLVPKRRTWFTALGATTLYAYLLHGFVTRFLQFFDLWGMPWMNTWWGIAIIIVCAAVVGTLLCSKPVVKVMSWALEPKLKWAFTGLRRPGGSRRPQAAAPAPAPAVEPVPPAPETGPFTGAFGEPPARRYAGTAPAGPFGGPTAEDFARPAGGGFGRPPAEGSAWPPAGNAAPPPAPRRGGRY